MHENQPGFSTEGRVDPLFQGRFQAAWVDKNEYLLHLLRYIHMNPVAAGLVARPEKWIFSSYWDYIGLREGTLPVPDVILSQFPSRRAYREFVDSYRELAMVTAYWQQPLIQADIARWLDTRGIGTPASRIERLAQRGFNVIYFATTHLTKLNVTQYTS